MGNRFQKIYRQLGSVTLVAVFLLILAGGIVRSTGSGMGCPDWPRCFGQWIPPTDISQLPANYKEIFKVKGKMIADFNPFKTWVEYINRLLGVLVGFFIFLSLLFSFSYFKVRRSIVFLSFASFVLVGFQGWIGAKVVSSDLAVSMVTLHMLIAILLVFVLIYTLKRSYDLETDNHISGMSYSTSFVVLLSILLLIVQIVLGTQVRESIDSISKAFQERNRELWIGQLDVRFLVHRSFSWIILLTQLYTVGLFFKNSLYKNTLVFKLNVFLVVLIVCEMATGLGMSYFSIPTFLQPFHLLFAILIISVQFFVWLMLIDIKPLKIKISNKEILDIA